MEHTIKTNRGWMDFDYFRPAQSNLLPTFFRNNVLFYLVVCYGGIFLSFILTAGLSFPLIYFIPKVLQKARLHDLQVRYLNTGVVPPQNGSAYGRFERKYWDSVEQRHRYRDDGWQ